MSGNRLHGSFRPTRLCPHRWCRIAHRATVDTALLGFGVSVTNDPGGGVWVLGVAVLILVTVVVVLRQVSKRWDPREVQRVMDKIQGEESRPVEVNVWWARLAVFTDVVLIAAAAMLLAGALVGLLDPAAVARAQKQNPPRWQDDVALNVLVVILLIGCGYAHWRATHRPRRRQRARVAATALARNS